MAAPSGSWEPPAAQAPALPVYANQSPLGLPYPYPQPPPYNRPHENTTKSWRSPEFWVLFGLLLMGLIVYFMYVHKNAMATMEMNDLFDATSVNDNYGYRGPEGTMEDSRIAAEAFVDTEVQELLHDMGIIHTHKRTSNM